MCFGSHLLRLVLSGGVDSGQLVKGSGWLVCWSRKAY